MIAIRPIGQRRASVRDFFSKQKISRCSALVLLATTLAVLAGCGGGSLADAGGGTGGGTTPPSTAPTLSLALLDSSGAATTALAAGAPPTFPATLKDAAGAPMPNTVISFASGDATLGVVSP